MNEDRIGSLAVTHRWLLKILICLLLHQGIAEPDRLLRLVLITGRHLSCGYRCCIDRVRADDCERRLRLVGHELGKWRRPCTGLNDLLLLGGSSVVLHQVLSGRLHNLLRQLLLLLSGAAFAIGGQIEVHVDGDVVVDGLEGRLLWRDLPSSRCLLLLSVLQEHGLSAGRNLDSGRLIGLLDWYGVGVLVAAKCAAAAVLVPRARSLGWVIEERRRSYVEQAATAMHVGEPYLLLLLLALNFIKRLLAFVLLIR